MDVVPLVGGTARRHASRPGCIGDSPRSSFISLQCYGFKESRQWYAPISERVFLLRRPMQRTRMDRRTAAGTRGSREGAGSRAIAASSPGASRRRISWTVSVGPIFCRNAHGSTIETQPFDVATKPTIPATVATQATTTIRNAIFERAEDLRQLRAWRLQRAGSHSSHTAGKSPPRRRL